MNDFAKINWRNFEILTGLLFELEFKLSRDEILLTRMVKDGGRDVQINKNYYSQILKFPKIEIWIEAKLRSKGRNVDMGDIAGSAIIASNSNITSIYFVTNCFFTAQTIEELLVFKEKTGLQICLIDGYQYKHLLLEHYSKLIHKFERESGEKVTAEGQRDFIKNLLDILPDRAPQNILESLEVNVARGKISPKSIYTESFKDEQKIELRKIHLTKNFTREKALDLNDIKLIPLVSDHEVDQNPAYQLIGSNRKELILEVLSYIYANKTIILTGNSGDGKTFFANHVARKLYDHDYNVVFTDSFESNILSYTKEIITSVIEIDYFRFLEDDEAVLNYLSDCFALDSVVAFKIIELIRRDKLSENISPEVCSEVLLRVMEKSKARKKILLIVDNLHVCSNDLLAFLKHLFIQLKEISVPVLCLTVSNADEKNISPENQWLKYLDTIATSNHFKLLTIPSLSKEDIRQYIQAVIPGGSENVIALIEKNTFISPFYVRLFIEYLKAKSVLKTSDGKFWWLDDAAVLLDSQNLRSNGVDTLVKNLMEAKFANEQFKRIASALFLFNNNIPENIFKKLFDSEVDSSFLKSGLFHVAFDEGNFVIKFSHDLFYYNFESSVNREELIFQASRLLSSINLDGEFRTTRSDVLGKLYECTGFFYEAYQSYLNYASVKYESAAFTSLLFHEKAIEMFLLANNSLIIGFSEENILAEIIFKVLMLYDQFNCLSARKSDQFFLLLQKFSDFGQLSKEQGLKLLYFLGLKFTKREDFKNAESYFKTAYQTIEQSDNYSEKLIDSIVSCYGINLKHIGKKEESMDFFEKAKSRWGTDQIRYQQSSNIAAYYLTLDPSVSLQCYQDMQTQVIDNQDLHLIVDLAMANFYLKNTDLALNYLREALILSGKQINLSEEARAENILGIIHWQQKNMKAAEHYLDLALSNGELANNHRWIWRIRTNIAQVAYHNQNADKSFNTCWAVAEHLLKTKEALSYEANNRKINSRRFAALKAISLILYRMQAKTELDKLGKLFDLSVFNTFLKDLESCGGDLAFDRNDQNLFGTDYYILG
jgi:tRNA A37 threonylcarbamoyladenosine biosynthesis protein TsaE